MERLRKDVIWLKGEEKAQPSQDNHEHMVKSSRRDQTLLPPKPSKRITIQAMSKQPRARNMEKGHAMVVDCMDMSGLCVHTRVGLTRLKPPNKKLLPMWPSKRRVMNQRLVSYARSWDILPRIGLCSKRQERKPKLQ